MKKVISLLLSIIFLVNVVAGANLTAYAVDSMVEVDLSGVPADIVFILDSSGSMGGKINSVINNLKSFAKVLLDKNIDARFALIDYEYNYTVHQYGGTYWTDSVDDLQTEMSSISIAGGTEKPLEPMRFVAGEEWEWRDNSTKFVFLLTDESEGYYGDQIINSLIESLKSKEIHTSVVTTNNLKSTFQSLYEETGGRFFNISSSNYYDLMNDYADSVIETAIYTSTGYVYDDLYAPTDDLQNVSKSLLQNWIPGIKKTAAAEFYTGSYSVCESMVPQGVCFAGSNNKYMLISAYCAKSIACQINKADKYIYEHNSVIYVLSNDDPENRKLITTVSLPDHTHCGGLAYDGTRIWIASTTKMQCINFSDIETIVESGKKYGKIKNYFKTLKTEKKSSEYSKYEHASSFVTFYDNLLVVGSYNDKGDGKLCGYDIFSDLKNIEKKPQFTMPLPKFTQGAEFVDYNGNTYLILSISENRTKLSETRVYKPSINSNTKFKGTIKINDAIFMYKYPCMAEDLTSSQGFLYTNYESASDRYYGNPTSYIENGNKGKATSPTDRITVSSTKDLVLGTCPADGKTFDITASGYCGSNVYWVLYSDGSLNINGFGNIYDYSESPFLEYSSQINNIYIGKGITRVGNNSFKNLDNIKGINIMAGSYGLAIGENAFVCSRLENVNIQGEGASTVTVEDSSIAECSNLSNISITGCANIIFRENFNISSSITLKTDNGELGNALNDGSFSVHIHNMEKTSTISETCNSEGYDIYSCCGCDYSYEIVTQEATGKHTFNDGVCVVCGEVETLDTSHTFSNYIFNNDATCTEDGTETAYCDDCAEISDTRISKGTAHHIWNDGEVVLEPTCVDKGIKKYKCTVCEIEKSKSIVETGVHTWNDGEIILEPTCNREGEMEYTCTVCSEKKTEGIEKSAIHIWNEGSLIREPSCAVLGEKEYICNVCGTTKTEKIEKLPHQYETTLIEPTCIEKGYTIYSCVDCGNTYNSDYVNALGHNYVDGICRRCYKTEPIIHLNENLNVNIEKGGYIELIKFVPEESGTYCFYSDVAVDTYGYLYDSKMKQLTSNDDGGNGSNFLISYSFEAGKTYYLGAKYYSSSKTGSFYVGLFDSYTDDGHRLNFVKIVEPTCTTDGYDEYVCELCNRTQKLNVVSAFGHSYTAETTDPTCTENGKTIYICTICNNQYTEIINRLGHNYVDGICNRCDKPESVIHLNENLNIDIEKGGYVELIKFIPEESGTYYFYSDATVDTYGYLYDSEMKQLKSNDNGGNGSNFLISYSFEAGKTYYLGAKYYSSSKTGSFYVGLFDSCTDDGHKLQFVKTVESTCTTGGYDEYICELCNRTIKNNNTTALGHQYVSETTLPTCLNRGYTTYKCTVCNNSYNSDYVNAIGHAYTSVITAPKCTNQGFTEYTCATCGNTYRDSFIEAIGHNYIDGVCESCGNDRNIYLDIEKTAVIDSNNKYAYFEFIPTETGTYTFSSISEDDTYGYLYDSDMNEIASDDDGGNDYNFAVKYKLQANTKYIFGCRYYNNSTGEFNVVITKNIEIQYTPIKPIEIIEKTNGRWETKDNGDEFYRYYTPWFNHRDVLTVTNKDGSVNNYIYIGWQEDDCAYFEGEDGTLININDISFSDDQYSNHWTIGSENYFTIEYMGAEVQVPVSIVENPVKSIEFTPINPIEIIENTHGEWDCNDNEEEYYCYYIPRFNYGDMLTVTNKDGSVNNYIYIGWQEDDCAYFEGEDGTLININDISFSDDQYSNHWTIGSENYFTIEYMGAETQVPITITENPVESVEFIQNEPYEIMENTNGYWDEDSDENFYFHYDYSPEKNTTVILHYKDGTEKSFYDFYSEDGEYLSECSWSDYPEYQGYVHWYVGNTYQYKIEIYGYECIGDVSIIENNHIHQYVSEVFEPTCSQDGYTHYYCDECGDSYNTDYVDATGVHIYVNGFCKYCHTKDVDYILPTISVGETKTVNIENGGDYCYFSFTPETDGNYIFSSNSNNDTYGYLYDSDMNEIASDDDGGYDNNFSMRYDFEAGKTYILGCRYYSSDKTGSFDVSLIENPIESIEFTPSISYEIIENTKGYWDEYWYDDEYGNEQYEEYWRYEIPEYNNGDKLTIIEKDGTRTDYIFNKNEWDFISANGDILDYPSKSNSQSTKHWTLGNENYFTIGYMGAEVQVPVSIVESPVESIEFTPSKLYEIIENTHGYWDDFCYEDENGNEQYEEYWHYEIPEYNNGDKLTVLEKDGTRTDYIFDENEWDFISVNGEVLDWDYIDASSNQYSNHWTIGGENYFTVKYIDATVQVPVSIIENPVDSIEYAPVNGFVNSEGITYAPADGGTCHFRDGYVQSGDKLTVNYKNAGIKEYFAVFDNQGLYEFITNDGEKLDEKADFYLNENDDGDWNNPTSITVNCYGKSIELPISAKVTIEAIEFTPIKPITIIESNGHEDDRWTWTDDEGNVIYGTNVYWGHDENGETTIESEIFNIGDVINVTYSNGKTANYTYYANRSFEYGYAFIGDDGSVFYVGDIRSNQDEQPWTVDGDNYFTINFSRVETERIPVTIVKNVDTSALQASIEKFGEFNSADYSESSYNNLKNVVDKNKSLIDVPQSQQEVDRAVTEILEAIYDLQPYLNFNVSTENGSYEVTCDEKTSSDNKYSLLFGTEITLSATANDGYEFVGWYDVTNNLYFSKESTYTFKLTTNTNLKAVFVKEQSATLTFTTYSNWVQSTVTKTIGEWNSITSIEDLLPEVPYRYGYSNGRWVYNNAEVLIKLQTGESVFLIPEYDEDDTSLPTPRESVDGVPALDLYYKLDADANVGSFVMAAGIPDDCQIESVGIAFYYKKANAFDPTKFELLNNNKMLVSRFNTDEIEDIYIVNMNKFTSTYNWAARGYVTYYDADGNLKTAYSNQINIINREQV